MNKTIKEMWQDFADRTMTDDCHPLPRGESRKAFYAGAWSFMMAVNKMILENKNAAQGQQQCQAWMDELEIFLESVKGEEA